jgi:tetratricopeptide (TPR) repeat protein/predicted Ser/Thr protein kinase
MSDRPVGSQPLPGDQTGPATLAPTLPAVGSSEPEFGYPPGTRVGRFVIMKPIARGGMGAVMLAYDTQLARSVALKVMLTSVASDEARERMYREAQAMARLSHPNVVGIYDVGIHDGDVFLAMEYVDGVTLREWLLERHSRRELLAVMKQAGRGLAAAHKAGIVHRDFKPSNVIVGTDGRVCVLDFGVARGVRGDEPPSRSAPVPTRAGARPLLDHTLTEEGSLLGTVGYAAPEVMMGLEVDARADVFSFSATLWRALYGTLPFPSSRLDEYLEAVSGAQAPQPPGPPVPRWLRDVLMRGLALDASARFSSMEELLAALDADPRRRHVAVAVAALVATAAAFLAVGKARHDAALRAECRAEGDAIASSWSPAVRESVRRAMLAEPDTFAGERTGRTLERLDDYARAWSAEQTASCEATRIRRTQPEGVHDQRSLCLLQGRTQLEVTADVLASDAPGAHRQSLARANDLLAPRLCTAGAAEKMVLSLPADPSARAKLTAVQGEILRADVLRLSGDLDGAQRLGEQARAAARAAGDRGLEASAERTIGKVLERRYREAEALEHHRRAVALAESVGADHLAGIAAADVASLLKGPEARGWLDLAHAKLERLGGDETLELRVAVVEASLQLHQDEAGALQANARVLDLARRVDGEVHPEYCTALHNRGVAFATFGHASSSEPWFRQAIECQVRVGGPHEPELGLFYGNLADVLFALGRWDEAIDASRRAAEARLGLDPRDPMLCWIYGVEAAALDGAGRFAEAEDAARRAIDRSKGDEEDLPSALFALGRARAGQGDPLGAKAACARSTQLSGPQKPEDLYELDALGCLGEAELSLGEVAAAREHLAASVALPLRLSPGALSVARFALARALAASSSRDGARPEVDRARALAEQARDELRGIAADHPFRRSDLDDVERWLAGLSGPPAKPP